jgi:hypothetical protein
VRSTLVSRSSTKTSRTSPSSRTKASIAWIILVVLFTINVYSFLHVSKMAILKDILVIVTLIP